MNSDDDSLFAFELLQFGDDRVSFLLDGLE